MNRDSMTSYLVDFMTTRGALKLLESGAELPPLFQKYREEWERRNRSLWLLEVWHVVAAHNFGRLPRHGGTAYLRALARALQEEGVDPFSALETEINGARRRKREQKPPHRPQVSLKYQDIRALTTIPPVLTMARTLVQLHRPGGDVRQAATALVAELASPRSEVDKIRRMVAERVLHPRDSPDPGALRAHLGRTGALADLLGSTGIEMEAYSFDRMLADLPRARKNSREVALRLALAEAKRLGITGVSSGKPLTPGEWRALWARHRRRVGTKPPSET